MVMRKVRRENTAPEMIVRRALHGMGYRFRLHRRDLPGRPDIVLPKHKAIIFVHGCFWHGHPGCRRATRPTRLRCLQAQPRRPPRPPTRPRHSWPRWCRAAGCPVAVFSPTRGQPCCRCHPLPPFPASPDVPTRSSVAVCCCCPRPTLKRPEPPGTHDRGRAKVAAAHPGYGRQPDRPHLDHGGGAPLSRPPRGGRARAASDGRPRAGASSESGAGAGQATRYGGRRMTTVEWGGTHAGSTPRRRDTPPGTGR